MTINHEVITPSNKTRSKKSRCLPKLIIYSSSGIGVLILLLLNKIFLLAIGINFLLAYIWSQAKKP